MKLQERGVLRFANSAKELQLHLGIVCDTLVALAIAAYRKGIEVKLVPRINRLIHFIFDKFNKVL